MFFLNNQDLAKKLRDSWEKASVVVGSGRDAALVSSPCATKYRLGRVGLLPPLSPRFQIKRLPCCSESAQLKALISGSSIFLVLLGFI